MKYSIALLCFLLLGGSILRAQSVADPVEQFRKAGELGQVNLEADSLLLANYYKLRVKNSKIKGIPGFRIRIYSDSGLGAKEEQQRIRAKFLTLYPEIDAYNKYDEPFFKVYVGDCRTRSEALKLFDQIRKNFPNPILVEDYIKTQ